MKILVGRTFGIGNAVCSIPMLKSLRAEQPNAQIDLLLGNGPDDAGAVDVMRHLRFLGIVDDIHINNAKGTEYDVAILSIPYDGRWENGRDFKSKIVMDGRSRPDPSTFGFSSWLKHEAEYQMENAYFFGYSEDKMPSCSFFEEPPIFSKDFFENTIYLGLGYKKDRDGFWAQKHWGNENYANLLRLLFERNKTIKIATTGDEKDLELTINPIRARLNKWNVGHRFTYIPTITLRHAFAVVNSCHMYLGNDTGTKHIAAACNRKVIAIYNMDGASRKSGPLCEEKILFENWRNPVDYEQILGAIKALRAK